MGIVRLEVENFKSYRDRQVIGPFKNFQGVIGPNGGGFYKILNLISLGKSNVMDAIAFVLGLKVGRLKSAKLDTLMYSTPGTETSAKSKSYVKMLFATPSGDEFLFQRSVLPNGDSEYRVDNKVVSFKEYGKKMEEAGIPMRAKLCLVLQVTKFFLDLTFKG
jgi:structural maintenance of chromosome 1